MTTRRRASSTTKRGRKQSLPLQDENVPSNTLLKMWNRDLQGPNEKLLPTSGKVCDVVEVKDEDDDFKDNFWENSFDSCPSPTSLHKEDGHEENDGNDDEKPEDTDGPKLFYVSIFNKQLDEVMAVESFLFSDEELSIIQKYRNLSDDAKRLFVRLILRKRKWIKLNSLSYKEINDLRKASEELTSEQINFAESERSLHDLNEAVQILTLEELKQFVRDERINVKTSNIKKSDVHSIFHDILDSQSSLLLKDSNIFTIDKDLNGRIKHIVSLIFRKTGPLIRLSQDIVSFFKRFNVLYYRHLPESSQSFSVSILSEISRMKFPKYQAMRTPLVFPSRCALIEYETALQLLRDVDECVTLKSIDRGLELCNGLLDKWKTFITAEMAHFTGIYFLARFTPGWIYTMLLDHYCYFLSLKKQYVREAEVLSLLLSQKLFRLGKRGKWYDRLALVQHRYLIPRNEMKRTALKTCIEGIRDKWVMAPQMMALQKRIQALEVELRIPRREQHNFCHLTLREASYRVLYAKRLPSSDLRPLYEPLVPCSEAQNSADSESSQNDDREGVVVEQFALQWYQLNEGWNGYHSENSILNTLFGLLFWDILFEVNPGGVFETEYQIKPLDLTTDAFYHSRVNEIQSRLNEISSGLFLDIITRIDDRERPYKTCCVGLNWDFSKQEILDIAEGLGPKVLPSICKVLAEDFRHMSAGFPDLCLFKSDVVTNDKGESTQKKRVRFVEVKGVGDRLSMRQSVWIDILVAAGADVEKCDVKLQTDSTEEIALKGKRKRQKTSGTRENPRAAL
ncbi:hypothetical protein BKA69DRAFT_609341 [Paraphysoderma sedebokerense]|nr:hypothetical protein BKA69DRAFT_609341 [Paraphysoderma sedebokerense]